MRISVLLIGLFLVCIGIGAIAGADFWDNSEWILAGAALTLGVGGLASVAIGTSSDQNSVD